MAKPEKRSGSYSTRVSLTDPLTGERKQKRVTARTKRELDAEVTKLKAAWNSGTYIEPEETTLGAYLADWLTKGSGKEATQFNHERFIRVHVAGDRIAAIPLGKLRLAHVQDFVDRKVAEGLAAGYVARSSARSRSPSIAPPSSGSSRRIPASASNSRNA